MAQKKRGGRKPRQPRRAAPVSRIALEAQLLQKTRIVQLMSRMTVLELFLGLHDSQPPLQSRLEEE